MSTRQAPTRVTKASYVSVNEAAHMLGVSPWDVERLMETDAIKYVTMVHAASVEQYLERQS